MPRLGRHVYGAAAILLGAVGLAWGDFAAVWQPFPDDAPARGLIAYLVAALFVVGGIALQWRRSASLGGVLCAALCMLFAFFWFSMRLVAQPQMFAMYLGVAEQLGMAMGGLVAVAALTTRAWAPRLVFAGRIVFGVCCVAFGVAHMLYTTETAAMVPAWLPPDANTWALATGAAHIAGGLALIFGVLAQLAARLLTAMFVVFGALVWAPQLIAAPHEHMPWAGNAINAMLIGAAWVIADAISRKQDA